MGLSPNLSFGWVRVPPKKECGFKGVLCSGRVLMLTNRGICTGFTPLGFMTVCTRLVVGEEQVNDRIDPKLENWPVRTTRQDASRG